MYTCSNFLYVSVPRAHVCMLQKEVVSGEADPEFASWLPPEGGCYNVELNVPPVYIYMYVRTFWSPGGPALRTNVKPA